MIDQSRVAVAVTAERLKNDAVTRELDSEPLPDLTIEHWGVYETEKLSEMPPEDFRQFVLHCYDARIPSGRERHPRVQGDRARESRSGSDLPSAASELPGRTSMPSPKRLTKLDRYQGDEGVARRHDAGLGIRGETRARRRSLLRRARRLGTRLGSPQSNCPGVSGFSRSRVQSIDRAWRLLRVPHVRSARRWLKSPTRRSAALTFDFSAGSSQVFNAGAKLINVQWDFNHRGRRLVRRSPTRGSARSRARTQVRRSRRSTRFRISASSRSPARCRTIRGGEGMETIQVKVQ